MINLVTKYANKLPRLFGIQSLTAGRTSEEFDWNGTSAIVAIDMVPQDLGNYTRSGTNRFGTPTDVQDWKQTMTISKDRSVSLVVDKGDRSQQMMLKNAGKVIRMQTVKKVVPEIDQNAFTKWAQNAGKVVDAGATIDKTNIAEKLLDLETALDDEGVPKGDRYCYIKSTYKKALRLSDEFDSCDTLKERLVMYGKVGEFSTFHIIAVPSGWMPTNVACIVTYKESVFAPKQIAEANLHQDPPGISGHQIDMRYIYDAFVYGALAAGVVILVENGKKTATPTATKGSTTTALASTTNSGTVDIYYTLDGTDPRYSDSRVAYSSPITNPDAGVVIKAVAHKFSAGFYGSDILTHTCV